MREWTFTPTMGRIRWPVRQVTTPGELSEWLGLSPTELDWFADVRSLEPSAADERLRRYRYACRPP